MADSDPLGLLLVGTSFATESFFLPGLCRNMFILKVLRYFYFDSRFVALYFILDFGTLQNLINIFMILETEFL